MLSNRFRGTHDPVKNPECKNGRCPDHGKKFKSSGVRLRRFDVRNPLARRGPILNPDEVVICDTRFDVIISYPLSGPIKIAMLSPSDKGFTRRELIDSLKYIYEFIYREEERTATPTVYEYREACATCENKSLEGCVSACGSDDRCSICYEVDKKTCCALPCGHKFHKHCVLPWIKKHNTCPLCRRYVKSCDGCKGLGFVTHVRENVVIPPEERGFFHNRNTTDGIFGIWGHDFDDLILEGLLYDHKNKLLRIYVGS